MPLEPPTVGFRPQAEPATFLIIVVRHADHVAGSFATICTWHMILSKMLCNRVVRNYEVATSHASSLSDSWLSMSDRGMPE
jgi:hypothetical protein